MNNLTFDVEAAKEQLTQIFRDRIAAQGSVYNVQNVDLEDVLFSELEQKIAGQDQLLLHMKGDLKTAQDDGEKWFNDVQPQLTLIPQAAINYATLWNNTIPLVLDQLGQPSPNRRQLQDLFGGLKKSIEEQTSSLSGLLASLQMLRTVVASDAENFSDKHESFQQLEEVDKENLAAARATLDKIKLMISQLSDEIDVDTIKAEKDLAIASTAMKYGKMFGTPGKVLGLTVGLVFIASASFAIDDLIASIHRRLEAAEKEDEYELEMTSLTTQLISLETASSALASLVGELDDLTGSLRKTIDGWNMDVRQVAAVIADLQGEQPVSAILSHFDLGQAQAEWEEIRVFAMKWQTIEVSPVASNELVLSPSTQLAKAQG